MWAVSFLVLAALAIGILAVRSGLKSVRRVSEMAAAIAPTAAATPVAAFLMQFGSERAIVIPAAARLPFRRMLPLP